MHFLLRLILVVITLNLIGLLAIQPLLNQILETAYKKRINMSFLIEQDLNQVKDSYYPDRLSELTQYLVNKYAIHAEIWIEPEDSTELAESLQFAPPESTPSLKSLIIDPNDALAAYNISFTLPIKDNYFLLIIWQDTALIGEKFLSWANVFLAILITFSTVYLYLHKNQKRHRQLKAILSDFPEMSSHLEKADLNIVAMEVKSLFLKKEQEQRQKITEQRELFHGVAHEFRSPMAKMQFALELIEEEDKQGQEKLITKINVYLSNLDHLVKELLFYSEITSSRHYPDFAPLNLKDLVGDAIESIAPLYPETQFEYPIAKTLSVHAEAVLFERLLSNLLRNAGRFAKSRCLVRAEQSQHHIRLSIEDDGPGIPIAKRDTIFAPFTRLDTSRSRDSGGCGLGLAIVASIAKKHHASIQVESSRWNGAKFTLEFTKNTP